MSKFTASIEGYGYDGEGVCRVDGKVVFVPHTLKDEMIEGEIVESRSSFSKAQLKNVLKSSPLRQNPPCPYFGTCGGCAYQHTDYDNELQIKKELLQSQLKKVGFEKEIFVIKSPQEYAYRNKIRMFVCKNGLALRKRASSNLCPIKSCLLVSDKMNRAIEILNSFLQMNDMWRYFKEIVIREENDKLLINLFTSVKNTKIDYQGLFLRLGGNFGIFETYQNKTIHKIGLTSLQCEEFGLNCKFSPKSFHQVNRFLTKDLYQHAIDQLKGDVIVNCYSGAGVLSGVIAQTGKRVIGIELGESEHQDAQTLKEENALFYLSNLKGDCAEVLPKLQEKIDSVIVDPPRAGIDKKVAESLDNLDFERLVYISCNSATLVRDIGRLKNFKVEKIMLFDMFARTGEYETLAILNKNR